MITMDPVAHIFCLLIIFDRGLSQLIITQRKVTSAIGEDVVFKCHLSQSKDVRQVSWQKIAPGGVENVGSYSLRAGQWVNPTFVGKVEFGNAELLNSSIVVRAVSKRDECCYRCLFNAYPEGALIGNTCLIVHELHSPVLQITSNATEDLTVSCSTTGQPAPTVVLNFPDPISVVSYSSASVANTNGTVTVIAAATFPALSYRGNGTRVRCVASLMPEIVRVVSTTIPAAQQSFAPGVFQALKDNGRDASVAVIVIAFCSGALAGALVGVIIALWIWKNRQTGSVNDLEKTKTPVYEKVISGVQELLVSSVGQRCTPTKTGIDSPSRVRQRSTPIKTRIQTPIKAIGGNPSRQGENMKFAHRMLQF